MALELGLPQDLRGPINYEEGGDKTVWRHQVERRNGTHRNRGGFKAKVERIWKITKGVVPEAIRWRFSKNNKTTGGNTQHAVHSCVFAAFPRVAVITATHLFVHRKRFLSNRVLYTNAHVYSPRGFWKACFPDPFTEDYNEEDNALRKLRVQSLDNAWELLGKYGLDREDHVGHRAPIPLHACCVC
jgi:hypothetical protein